MLFGPPLRRGSSEYHQRQVRWRHRYWRSAKNSRRAPGSQPGYYSDRLLDNIGVFGLPGEAVLAKRAGC